MIAIKTEQKSALRLLQIWYSSFSPYVMCYIRQWLISFTLKLNWHSLAGKTIVYKPADGIGAEKVQSTRQEQGWQGWTAKVGHDSLWKQNK